jgi:hypothetical protein
MLVEPFTPYVPSKNVALIGPLPCAAVAPASADAAATKTKNFLMSTPFPHNVPDDPQPRSKQQNEAAAISPP